MKVFVSRSASETEEFGRRLGSALVGGDVVALSGDLGAGKTTLTRGIALGLEVRDDVFSPTFTLVHEHRGRLPLYHIDLYRITGEEEASLAGIEEYLNDDGVTVIEWAERAVGLLPEDRIEIEIVFSGDNEREIRVKSSSGRILQVLESFTENVDTCD